MMTGAQSATTILMIALGAAITRFAPFILFPEGKRRPRVVEQLSRLLPPAMMGFLLVYCFRNVWPGARASGAAELLGAAITAALHLWKRNVLLSIAGGTIAYMLLIRFVFS